jgi:periplasmic divalent cation tolerance protein
MYIVKTSLDSRSGAEKMLLSVMSERKAACCYLYEVRSDYWWGGELNEEIEYILEFKVGEKETLKDDLVSMLRKEHPYDLPVIEVVRAEVDPEVDDWANDPQGYTPQI